MTLTVSLAEKHEFALFVADLSVLIKHKEIGYECVLSDEQLCHRVMHVLRIAPGQTCVFFDQLVHIRLMITQYKGKKHLVGLVQDIKKNIQLAPKITFLLPILKRDDFEQALYGLAAVGVTTIQCIATQKTSLQWTDKDNERAQRIIIAAAEQSKSFAFPVIKSPIPLMSALEHSAEKKIFFDPQGQALMTVMTMLECGDISELMLLVGPEGDLSNEEKNAVHTAGFIMCALTPTILRSVHAAFLGAGIMRSVMSARLD